MSKVFKNIDEQVEMLKSKGLTVEDESLAKEILLRENYFFINGYRFLFMKSTVDKRFVVGSTFRELYAMFNFDRQIRNILFKNLLIIENNTKSILSYTISKVYGIRESDYLNPANFNRAHERSRQVNDLLKKMRRQIKANAGSHTATLHYQNNYGFIPFWIAVKVLSFGIVGELYLILKQDDQKVVADFFGVSVNELETYLPILSNYRNLCAHEEVLYNHRMQRRIDDTKYHSFLNIPKMDGEYIYGKDDLFALIIILKRMLRKDDFNMMLKEIEYEICLLDGKLDSISIGKVLDSMGFPVNYTEMERID